MNTAREILPRATMWFTRFTVSGTSFCVNSVTSRCLVLTLKLMSRMSMHRSTVSCVGWRWNATTLIGTRSAYTSLPSITQLSPWHPLLPYGMGAAIKHPVPDQGWASECLDVKNYKWRLNPIWHNMFYSCTHMATRLYISATAIWELMLIYTMFKKTLWNGIAVNYKGRFWWHLAEIFKRL